MHVYVYSVIDVLWTDAADSYGHCLLAILLDDSREVLCVTAVLFKTIICLAFQPAQQSDG